MYQVKERETEREREREREREISQVVKAQKLANISSTLPLLPSADNDALDTYFWVKKTADFLKEDILEYSKQFGDATEE